MVIFFGLTNFPVMFQIIMNKILRDLINTGKIMSFIDDVIIRTEKKERHDKIVEEVVKRLAENNLYIKPEKYKWEVQKVKFLRVVIGLKEINMEQEKIKGILDWPTPKGVKDIQKFLELANYYHQFIKDFARIAKPLHNMIKRYQKWEWIEEDI